MPLLWKGSASRNACNTSDKVRFFHHMVCEHVVDLSTITTTLPERQEKARVGCRGRARGRRHQDDQVGVVIGVIGRKAGVVVLQNGGRHGVDDASTRWVRFRPRLGIGIGSHVRLRKLANQLQDGRMDDVIPGALVDGIWNRSPPLYNPAYDVM